MVSLSNHSVMANRLRVTYRTSRTFTVPSSSQSTRLGVQLYSTQV